MLFIIPSDIMAHIQGYADASSLVVLWAVGVDLNIWRCAPSVAIDIIMRSIRDNLSGMIPNIVATMAPRTMLNSCDPISGFTPLTMSAFVGGSVETIIFLLENGAGINTPTAFGDTPLAIAAQRGHNHQVAFLLGMGAVVDTTNTVDRTPLFHAVESGHAGIVRALLDHGADPNTRTTNHKTSPLMSATISGRVVIVQMLLDAGATVHDRNIFGHTALLLAVHFNEAEIIRMLMEHGADPLAQDHEGNSPASIGIRRG